MPHPFLPPFDRPVYSLNLYLCNPDRWGQPRVVIHPPSTTILTHPILAQVLPLLPSPTNADDPYTPACLPACLPTVA